MMWRWKYNVLSLPQAGWKLLDFCWKNTTMAKTVCDVGYKECGGERKHGCFSLSRERMAIRTPSLRRMLSVDVYKFIRIEESAPLSLLCWNWLHERTHGDCEIRDGKLRSYVTILCCINRAANSGWCDHVRSWRTLITGLPTDVTRFSKWRTTPTFLLAKLVVTVDDSGMAASGYDVIGEYEYSPSTNIIH